MCIRLPMLPTPFVLLVLFVAAACSPPEGESETTLWEDDDHAQHADVEGVGSVTFPVSCTEAAAESFERAVAILHSFWFEEAYRAFHEITEVDSDCAMAHWGLAMTLWGNPMTRVPPPEARVEEALNAIEAARSLAGSATHREHMYIEAAAVLYEGHPEIGHIQRMRAHEDAMRELMESHPEDPEAAIFYGRIAVGNAPPDDLTYSRQLHAAEIMEPLFRERPNHPGLAHYIIHAYDVPPLAEEGVEAALLYADIAPDAPHALHMPTHIFTRMGYWEESIELNARSAQAEPDPDAAVHPLDYMVYAYLQLGRDQEAAEVVSRIRNISDSFYGGTITYNFAAIPARYALERSRWEEAAAAPVPEDAPAYAEAVSRFARALGSARSGDPGKGAEELAHLVELRDALAAEGDDYWATVVEAQRLAAEAWLVIARGDSVTALTLANEAADLEDTFEKHPVTPGPLLPARELLGDLLMELDRPGEAQAEYEATLEVERNRARARFGAARAAEQAGDQPAEARHYEALAVLLQGADPERPDLQAVMAWTGRN